MADELREALEEIAEQASLMGDEAVGDDIVCFAKLHKIAIDALAAPAPAVGWQPIETAPKDGALVIVDGGVAYWHTKLKHWRTLTGEEWPGREIQWKVTRWRSLRLPGDEAILEEPAAEVCRPDHGPKVCPECGGKAGEASAWGVCDHPSHAKGKP